MTTIQHIFELQELDWKIDRFKNDLESVDKHLHDQSALIKAKARVLALEKTLLEMQRNHMSESQEVVDLKEQAGALEKKLYGGSVRNPKELESLQLELSYSKKRLGEHEEKLINLMIEVVENGQLTADAKLNLTNLQADWAASQISLTEERSRLVALSRDSTVEREQIVASISPSQIAQYERIKAAKQGYAVAKIERGQCTGCRLTLPTKDLQRARNMSDISTCGSCGRILYMS